jgi:hypothetical protein
MPSEGRISGSAASPPKERKTEESMFARLITLQLKPSLAKEFPLKFEKEVVPLLRQNFSRDQKRDRCW